MTLSNITALSSFTDKAPVSPTYMNAKWGEVQANFDAVGALPLTVSGATVTIDPGTDFVAKSYDSGGFALNAKLYCRGNTSTDDAAGLRLLFAAGAGRNIEFPPGNYRIESTVTISSAVKLFGPGGQGTMTFYKATTDDMFRIENANVEFHNIGLDCDTGATSGATSGWGLNVVGGTANTNFKFLGGAINSMNSCINFADDSGGGSVIANCRIAPFTGVSAGEGIAVKANADSGARQRFLCNVNAPGGYISLVSTNDTFITNCAVKRVDLGANAFGTHVQGCRLGNSSSTMTLDGNASSFVGNAISGPVVLAATFDGVYVGNVNSSGSLIDQSTQANVLVADAYEYRMASGGTMNLNQSRLVSVRTLAASALTTSAANTNVIANELVLTLGGASGASLAIHSGGTVYIFNSALSAKAT